MWWGGGSRAVGGSEALQTWEQAREGREEKASAEARRGGLGMSAVGQLGALARALRCRWRGLRREGGGSKAQVVSAEGMSCKKPQVGEGRGVADT